MIKPIIDTTLNINDSKIYIIILKLHKSYLFLISDVEDFGIGTVSMGIPSTLSTLKPTSSSYQLFGVQSDLLNRTIVESASYKLNSPVLLILYLKDQKVDQDMAKNLIKSFDCFL